MQGTVHKYYCSLGYLYEKDLAIFSTFKRKNKLANYIHISVVVNHKEDTYEKTRPFETNIFY